MTISLRRPSESPDASDRAPSAKKKKEKAPAAPRRAPGVEEVRIGGEPRVDLLPPEVRSSRRNASTRRGFMWGFFAVLLVVVLAIVGAFGYNVVSQTQLVGAQLRASQLVAEQQKYIGVRDVQKQVSTAQAAQQLAASTEVDWQPLLGKLETARPATMFLYSLKMDSINPMVLYQQSPDPLQGPRIGTVTIIVKSPVFPDTAAWLRNILKVDGVVDAAPGAVNRDETGMYTTSMTVHVSDSLYTKRFATGGK